MGSFLWHFTAVRRKVNINPVCRNVEQVLFLSAVARIQYGFSDKNGLAMKNGASQNAQGRMLYDRSEIPILQMTLRRKLSNGTFNSAWKSDVEL
jgi:hypothetical protein